MTPIPAVWLLFAFGLSVMATVAYISIIFIFFFIGFYFATMFIKGVIRFVTGRPYQSYE